MNLKSISASVITAASVILSIAISAQAGTMRQVGICSFSDVGNNNGGNVTDMRCLLTETEGLGRKSFTIQWEDGTLSRSESLGGKFTESQKGAVYVTREGDVISIRDRRYTSHERL